MSKFTKKWQKEFEKRYSVAVTELSNLEAEYKEMKDTNPDEWSLTFMTPKKSELDFGVLNDYSIYDYGDKVDIRFNGSIISVDFSITELKKLIEFRNELMKAIDTFERPLEKEKVVVDTNDCEDEEDDEVVEWTIKAEQPLTQSWTYTVMARSACEAIQMLEEDTDGEGIVNNDDNEYYDYGEIDYEGI
jgi:hypothetical protein